MNKNNICPIFKRTIEDGLCWEICFARSCISLDAIPELEC